MSNCVDVTIDTAKHNKENGWNGGVVKTADRYESDLTAVDPLTGEVEKTTHLSYPNYSGTLVTGGGLVFLGLTDGTFAAFADMTLDQLWKVNIGSGFSAPPMTFAFDGKQYVAVVSGPSSPSPIEEHQHAGTQGDAKRHGALRVRALGAIVSWPESG